jgi:UDP-GlcNAc:undecaprenyl-phosphate GlcNAc-1-phosphate transferase
MLHYKFTNIVYFFFITSLVFWIIQKNIFIISNNLLLVDKSDTKRKIPLLGGFFLIISLIIIFGILVLSNNKNYFLSEYVYLFTIFLIGAIDDAKNIKALSRLFLSAIVVFLIIITNEKLIINFLYVEKFYIFNNSFAIFFTILCFLLFQNALNLMDGINCLAISFCITVLLLLTMLNQNHIEIKIVLIVVCAYLLFLNQKNITFLGDGGVYVLSFAISIFTIETYKLDYKIFGPTDILMLFCIPGYDMLRLFVQRIANKKNPFTKDKNHLHHFLKRKISNLYLIILIYILSTISLFTISYYFNLKDIFAIFLSIAIYLAILIYAKN